MPVTYYHSCPWPASWGVLCLFTLTKKQKGEIQFIWLQSAELTLLSSLCWAHCTMLTLLSLFCRAQLTLLTLLIWINFAELTLLSSLYWAHFTEHTLLSALKTRVSVSDWAKIWVRVRVRPTPIIAQCFSLEWKKWNCLARLSKASVQFASSTDIAYFYLMLQAMPRMSQLA